MKLPTIYWTANANDDFIGECYDGWTLRIEQMDYGYWWWCIYYPESMKKERIEDCDERIAHTLTEAVDYATSAFYFHYLESQRQKIHNSETNSSLLAL